MTQNPPRQHGIPVFSIKLLKSTWCHVELSMCCKSKKAFLLIPKFHPCWKRVAGTEPVHGPVLTSHTSDSPECHGHAGVSCPLSLFHPFCFSRTCASFQPHFLELSSDNDTCFSLKLHPFPPPNAPLLTCQSCFSSIQVAIVLMIHFPCNPRSGW